MNENIIKLKVNPKDIAFIKHIFEGYDNLAIVTSLDGKQGLIILRVTPQTRKEVLDILNNFPKKIEIL